MVLHISKRFWFHDINDRQDSESFSLEYVIRRTNLFKFARGNDAFTYFTSMISRAFLRSFRKRKSKIYHSVNFTDVVQHPFYDGVHKALDVAVHRMIEDATPYPNLT